MIDLIVERNRLVNGTEERGSWAIITSLGQIKRAKSDVHGLAEERERLSGGGIPQSPLVVIDAKQREGELHHDVACPDTPPEDPVRVVQSAQDGTDADHV